MDVKGTDGMYVFDLVEPGHANQCNFLHPKHLRKEAERFLDEVFTHLLQGYGADYYRILVGGEGHMRREAQMQTCPKITEYLRNLKLASMTDIMQKMKVGLLLPPQNKQKKVHIISKIRMGHTARSQKQWQDRHSTL